MNDLTEVSKTEIKGDESKPKDHQKAKESFNVETKNSILGNNKSDKKILQKKI